MNQAPTNQISKRYIDRPI